MSSARVHATTASELLSSTDRAADRLEHLSDDERLQLAITGGFTRVNADLRWTAELAVAHALVALALSLTGDDDVDEVPA